MRLFAMLLLVGYVADKYKPVVVCEQNVCYEVRKAP